MNKRSYIGGITIIIIAVALVWGYSTFNKNTPKEYVVSTATGNKTINSDTGTVTDTVKSFTKAEIANHKDATSCYTIISGFVYDLTAWVSVHPGGKGPIVGLCGTDGTEKFMNKHKGGQKFMDVLARFKIGVVLQ